MISKRQRVRRRDFLHISCQLAGAYLVSAPLAARASESQSGGVYVGSRRVPVIDMHAHCGFREVETLVTGTALEREVAAIRILSPDRLQVIADRRVDV